jgi:WD40 repeat protein
MTADIVMLQPRWLGTRADYVRVLRWSPDGKKLAVALADGTVRLTNPGNGMEEDTREAHDGGVLCLEWSPDGRWLSSGGEDGQACLWDAAGDSPAEPLAGGSAWVEHLAWSPRGSRLATAAGRQLRLWNTRGEAIGEYSGHASTVTGLYWLREGRLLVTACYGGLTLWRTGQADYERHFPWKGSFVNLALSPNNRHCAAATQESSLLVFDLKSGEKVGMSGYPGKVKRLAWDSRSRYLATAAGNEAILWDFAGAGPAGSRPRQFRRHVDRINDLAFHPRQSVLATGGADGILILWHVPDGRITQLSILDGAISALAWSPTVDALAVGTASGAVACFDPASD